MSATVANARRRPSRAAVARSLREVQILWRPSENGNALREQGAGKTELDNEPNSTPARTKCKRAA